MNTVQSRVGNVEVRLPDDAESRTAEFTISTFARDSHHTVVNQRGWSLERYNRNPIVGYQHEVWGGTMCLASDPDTLIGTSVVTVTGKGQAARLDALAEFEPREINELAEKIYRKILFGSLRATSVGFMELGEGKWGDGDEALDGPNETYYFEGQELYEWSIVHMGSNPETVKRDAKMRASSFMNRAVAGLRALGADITVDQVMTMTVSDALRLLEAGERPERAALLSTTRAEARTAVAEFIKTNL